MTEHDERAKWNEVLDFWFPERLNPDFDDALHRQYWMWRMRGGADEAIIARYTDLTERASRGELDHWASEALGRLALILILDQFPRSIWRGSARAFSLDADFDESGQRFQQVADKRFSKSRTAGSIEFRQPGCC